MSTFTLEMLQKLEEAIAQGVRRVRYSDKEVEYASLDDMLRVRNLMRSQLGIASAKAFNPVYPRTSKGLTSG